MNRLIQLFTIGCTAAIGAIALVASAPRADEPTLQPDPLAYVAPSRDFDVMHTRVDLDLDLKHQTIRGSATHTLEALSDDAREIRLNCVRLTVDDVKIDGTPVDFEHPVPGKRSTSWIEINESREALEELVVFPKHPLAAGTRFDLEIRYHGAPKAGLYFIAPEKGVPGSRNEVWSQGEGEDNRYWIPCFDYPNDKATFEGIFRVDKGNYVLSNGVLVGTSEQNGRTQYHWRLDTPQVSYLMMVAAGKYTIVEDRWRDVPLMYLVPPGTNAAAVTRAFGLTGDMMEFFSAYSGVDYPFKKYAQVVVQDFIYGGMENTTATVMNTRILFDESAGLTGDQEGLVSHELAHQWWGDMVTCAEWSHLWLNEGWATYFAALYHQHHQGDDAFRYQMDRYHRAVIDRDENDARPIVVDFFNRRDSRNSANVYVKGASVLHMLRFLLGDERFRKSVQHYAETHKYENVETSDFTRAVKDVTGENLDWFFEQWLFLEGHPDLKVTQSWDSKTNILNLHVDQTQAIEKLTPVFRLPMDVEITTAEETVTRRVVIDRKSQDFYFTAPSKPLMVIVDKNDWTLKTLEFAKGTDELLYQLEHGDVMAKVRAMRSLAKKPQDRVVAALRTVALGDGFWGLRREAARALGKIATPPAAAALTEALSEKEGRVRLAAAEAMGDLDPDAQTDRALQQVFHEDPAIAVRAAAVTALAKMESDRANRVCLEALKTPSNNAVIRRAGLEGLATLEATDALGKVKALARPGHPRSYRHAAISSYAKLAKKLEKASNREAAADFLAGMLGDWHLRTRQTVIRALGTLGEVSAIDALEKTAARDPLEQIRAQAKKAAARLASGDKADAEKEDLQAKMKLFEDELQTLKKDLESVRSQLPDKPDPEKRSRSKGSDD